jgi:hypothetical protein
MQLFHKWRYEDGARVATCGGPLNDTETEDMGEQQYVYSRCGQRGKPIVEIDLECDALDNQIFLDDSAICVTDLLVPPSQFLRNFKSSMEQQGFEQIH